MKIWLLLFLSIVSYTTPDYFDTSFLVQYDTVEQALKDDGFGEVYFTTQDNIQLHGLFYNNPHAQATIICLAGWLPGRKETLAPFFTLFGKDYSILLVDARGHGKSEGPLFSNMWHYGITDYQDVIAAVNYIHDTTHKSIYIIGLCAGAFNAVHAAIALGNDAITKRVRGIVFDSGWASVYETSYTAPTARASEQIAKLIAWTYDIPTQQATKTFLCSVCSTVSTAVLYGIHTVLFKPAYAYYDTITNLNNTIARCPVPLFFIHSYDDTYADIHKVQNLAAKVRHKKTWWITEPSKHTAHHFKHTQQYVENVKQFFDSIV